MTKWTEERRKATSERMKGKPSNAGEFNRKHRTGKTYEEIFGKEKAEKIKNSQSLVVRTEDFKLNLSLHWKGRVFSEEHKKKLRGPKSQETKEKMSRTRTAMIQEGFNPHYNRFKAISCWLDTTKGGRVRCQGSYEKLYAALLDANNTVVKFEKDKIRIPYIFENKRRIYVVDFLVTYKERVELVEVKPSTMLEKEENSTKFLAARNWCSENNATFVVITEKEIESEKRAYDFAQMH